MSVSDVSDRLRRQVERDFPGGSDEVERRLTTVESSPSPHGRERLQAAVVFLAAGDVAKLRDAIALSQLDWRDVLVAAGLADENWRSVLDARLGPADERPEPADARLDPAGGRRSWWRRSKRA